MKSCAVLLQVFSRSCAVLLQLHCSSSGRRRSGCVAAHGSTAGWISLARKNSGIVTSRLDQLQVSGASWAARPNFGVYFGRIDSDTVLVGVRLA